MVNKAIHMRQTVGLKGRGWTKCGNPQCFRRTNIWERVTCKNCLRCKG